MAAVGESVGDNYNRLRSYQNSAIVHTFGKHLGDILSPVWRNYSHVITNIIPAKPRLLLTDDARRRNHRAESTDGDLRRKSPVTRKGYPEARARVRWLVSTRNTGLWLVPSVPGVILRLGDRGWDQFVSNSRPGRRGPGGLRARTCRGSGQSLNYIYTFKAKNMREPFPIPDMGRGGLIGGDGDICGSFRIKVRLFKHYHEISCPSFNLGVRPLIWK